MQIIHTKDYVPACTSNLCGFTFNTRGPTSALMEHCERLEINMHCHTTESSRDFRTANMIWLKGFYSGDCNGAELVFVHDLCVCVCVCGGGGLFAYVK